MTYLVSVEIFDGNECEVAEFILLDELFESLCLEVGDEIGEDLITLDHYSKVSAAYSSACLSFAYVQSSLKALYRKLTIKGFSKEVSRQAIDIMRERGFVDEENIAIRRAEMMVGKLWGRTRILKKLIEEGFPTSIIESVSCELEAIDFSENCRRVIEKKYSFLPDDRKEREKIYASLQRLGYTSADIRAAISRIE